MHEPGFHVLEFKLKAGPVVRFHLAAAKHRQAAVRRTFDMMMAAAEVAAGAIFFDKGARALDS